MLSTLGSAMIISPERVEGLHRRDHSSMHVGAHSAIGSITAHISNRPPYACLGNGTSGQIMPNKVGQSVNQDQHLDPESHRDIHASGSERSRLPASDNRQNRINRLVFFLCVAYWVGVVSVIAFILFINYYVRKAEYRPTDLTECLKPPSVQGYPSIEINKVMTSDGVTLELWHIPSKPTKPGLPQIPIQPVLILSGLQCSSRDWFAGLDKDALPWLLWDAGYDVWVGNNRGTVFSRTNGWNWNVLDMADYDFPTMVSAVIERSSATSLAFVGHSQGALQAFIHLSANVTTSKHISYLVGLAPPVYLSQQRLIWSILSKLHVDAIVRKVTARPGTPFSVYEEMSRTRCIGTSIKWLCKSCMDDMGGSFVPGTAGFAPTCEDKFNCIPAGTSSDNIQTFAEVMRLGSFQEYLTRIGRPINFTALTMNISLGAGQRDLLMYPADVARIRAQCRPASVLDFWVLPGSGHLDLVWGKEAPNKLYRPLVQRLQQHFRPWT